MKALRSSLAKVQRLGGREWCGYFTPSDLLALNAAGVKLKPQDKEWATTRAAEGKSNPRWIYFRLTKAQERELGLVK